MKKTEKLQSLSEVIDRLPSKKSESAFTCIQIHKNWDQIIGSRWASICKPIGYDRSCLIIQVPSSCHVNELRFQEEFFIKKINEYIGFNFLEDIRWTASS